MTTLTPYQQAVLTELGIVQWQLRTKPDAAEIGTPTHSGADAAQLSPSGQSAPRASAESAIARLKQAMQGSTTAIHSQPEPVQVSAPTALSVPDTKPMAEPLWIADSEPMFSDVLLALNWPEGLGSLRWQQADEFKLVDGILYCPAPAALATDSRLKRRLWQLLQAC
ncbi:hypothetical protein [Bowmanella denitrificans]|uniref:hypothetical protein n=1 Tax=Bowmanella denitrificans TaxID=366582 RepID=UPI000C99F75F|nr:hypothetical protein [Bowmanella denitrificans]